MLKWKERFISSSSGSSLLIVLVASSLLALLMGTGLSALNSMFQEYQLQKNKDEIIKSQQSVLSLFADQRFCNAFFSAGYSGQGAETKTFAISSFSPSSGSTHQTWIQERLTHLRESSDRFEVESFTLSNKTNIPNRPAGRELVQFDVEMSLIERPDVIALGPLRKIFGRRSLTATDIKEKLKLTLGNTGECYFQTELAANGSDGLIINAMKNSCSALAGEYREGRCYLKEYQLDTIINTPDATKPPIYNQATMSDALCEMEKNLIRKGRLAGATNPSVAQWPTLCAVPEWSGCIEGSTKYLPNQTSQVDEGMNIDQVKKHLKTKATPTLRMRYFQDNAGYSNALRSLSFNFNVDVDWGMVFAAGAAFGPIGALFQLFMDCDGARVVTYRTCRNGLVEVDRFDVYHEEMGFFSCDEEGPDTVTVPVHPTP